MNVTFATHKTFNHRDTLTFLGNYVDQIDTDLDRHKLKDFIKDVYTEASER